MSETPATRRPLRVLVVGASLRKESLNVRLAGLAARTAADLGAEARLVDFHDFAVPPLDPDVLEADGVPGGAQRFADLLAETDGYVIAAPEYNFSVSGVLKNLIDWVSRIKPVPFAGTHGLLLSASPGPVGGLRGLWALRIPLEGLGSHVYPDMFGLALANAALSDSDEIADAALRDRFARTLGGFLDLAEAARHYPEVRALADAAQ
jgi:chromate reductase